MNTTGLNRIIEEFLKEASGFTSEQWSEKPAPDKWSKKEIVGHLIDSAINNIRRFIRATYDSNFKTVYRQNEWVSTQHYHHADISELLTLWQLLNRRIITILNNYPEARLQTMVDIGGTDEQLVTVEFLAKDYVEHMQHHLRQIISK